ncbi:MAG: O-antigen ligase family protein [Eubacterium sp.]|nr:O-antigen ligase family protein [Eubacterium sp.]
MTIDRIKINIKGRTTFLYLFLFAGAFNDLLRLGTSSINLFRILLPVAIIVTLVGSTGARKVFLVAAIVGLVSFIQSLVFCSINEIGVRFSAERYFSYLLLYAGIAAVVAAVVMLHEQDSKNFFRSFSNFAMVVGICYLLVFMAIYHTHYDYSPTFILINNPNDYGAVIAAIIPVFYFRSKKSRHPLLLLAYIPVAMLYLVLNDCKLVLLGVLAQFLIVAYLEIRNRAYRYRRMILLPAILIFIIILIVVDALDVSLHGYSWKETIVEPIKALFRGEMYMQSNTSVLYRINTIIASIQWMFNSCFLGVGIGNAGALMRNVLGSHGLYGDWLVNETVSLHNAFLETLLDFGFVAIIGLVLLIRKIIHVLRNSVLDNMQMCFLTVVFSAVLWLQAPSVVLTDYMIFAIMAFLLAAISDKQTDTIRSDIMVLANGMPANGNRVSAEKGAER